MSLFDFFKFNHRTSVPSEVDEVLLSDNKSLYIDFDKMYLSVVGGFSYVMWPSLKGLFIKTDTTNKKEGY